MKKIILLIYFSFFRKLIKYRLFRNKTFVINNKKYIFHNLASNNLLSNIAINGYETHENEVVNLIKSYSWDFDEFYDIGSNFGYYAILVDAYLESISITAVEPFPLSYQYIEKLKKINSLSFAVINKAVDSVSEQDKKFYFPIANGSSKLPGSASLINSFKGSGGVFNDLPYETVSVKTVTLDEIVKDTIKGALIKIDIEGNEFSALKSSSIIGRDNVDFIIEIMINDRDKNDIFSLMKANGYNAFLITNAGLIHEDRPLTLPNPQRIDRTLWRNHLFTKKSISQVREFSINNYGLWI